MVDIKIENGKILSSDVKEISLRNFLKKVAQDYSRAVTEIERLKNEFEARIKPHNDIKKNAAANLKLVKSRLTAEAILELQKDKNAYLILHNAFPKVFKEIKKEAEK